MSYIAPLNGINIAARHRYILLDRAGRLLSEHSTRYRAIKTCRREQAREHGGTSRATVYRYHQRRWVAQPLPARENSLLGFLNPEF